MSDKQDPPHPMQVSGSLQADHPEAAEMIRGLYELARAQDKILCAYRTQSRPSTKALDRIGQLKHLMRT